LLAAIEDYLLKRNQNPKPYRWHAKGHEILAKLEPQESGCRSFKLKEIPKSGGLLLVLENADVWGKSDFLFAAEAQQIEHEHEHDSSKLRNPDINYSYLVNSTLA